MVAPVPYIIHPQTDQPHDEVPQFESLFLPRFCFATFCILGYLSSCAHNGDLEDNIDKPANLVARMDEANLAFSIYMGDIKVRRSIGGVLGGGSSASSIMDHNSRGSREAPIFFC